MDVGYAATTVQEIAQQAGVASATVYQAFGTKMAVLAAALDVTIAGDDEPLTATDRAWVTDAIGEPDHRRRLSLIVDGACSIAANTAALKEVVRDAAATEPGARDLIRQDHERRFQTQEHLVDVLVGDRVLRSGMDWRMAVDTFFTLVNSATHDLVVNQRGWTVDDWRDWLVDLIDRHFFETA